MIPYEDIENDIKAICNWNVCVWMFLVRHFLEDYATKLMY
jgi:hypothetical protein